MRKTALSQWMIGTTAVIALLATIASTLGIFTTKPYSQETQNWLLQARGQDIGNIIAAVLLLLSAWYATKGSVRAYLVWLGTMFYFLYAYVVYSFAVHFNRLFLVYVAILGLTLYTLIAAFIRNRVKADFPTGGVRKLSSYTLIAIGVLFGALWLGEIVPAILSGDIPQSLKDAGLWVNPIHVIDLSTVLPGFVITGYLALKNNRLGLELTAPWLTFSVIMGSSIVAAMGLMLANEMPNTIPPMIMVSAIVVLSLIALIRFLSKTK